MTVVGPGPCRPTGQGGIVKLVHQHQEQALPLGGVGGDRDSRAVGRTVDGHPSASLGCQHVVQGRIGLCGRKEGVVTLEAVHGEAQQVRVVRVVRVELPRPAFARLVPLDAHAAPRQPPSGVGVVRVNGRRTVLRGVDLVDVVDGVGVGVARRTEVQVHVGFARSARRVEVHELGSAVAVGAAQADGPSVGPGPEGDAGALVGDREVPRRLGRDLRDAGRRRGLAVKVQVRLVDERVDVDADPTGRSGKDRSGSR